MHRCNSFLVVHSIPRLRWIMQVSSTTVAVRLSIYSNSSMDKSREVKSTWSLFIRNIRGKKGSQSELQMCTFHWEFSGRPTIAIWSGGKVKATSMVVVKVHNRTFVRAIRLDVHDLLKLNFFFWWLCCRQQVLQAIFLLSLEKYIFLFRSHAISPFPSLSGNSCENWRHTFHTVYILF